MNIIELAREAGFTELEFFGNKVGTNVTECLERFAALVLEEAAKVCDGVAYTHQNASMLGPEQNALKCAAAIRALKGAKE